MRDELEGLDLDIEMYEPHPGRVSMATRYPGTDPAAPALMLMGHTDVVPVSPEGWKVDPFGGELMGGEVWGRGAVDMYNVTASMAVAFRHWVRSGVRFPGDIIYFAVADEEAGGKLGAELLIDSAWEMLQCDYVLTEYGGTPVIGGDETIVLMTAAEKGGAARRLHVHGEPGHGSIPYGTDNALVKAAEIVRRIEAYNPGARIDELFEGMVKSYRLDPEIEAMLLDPGRVADALAQIEPDLARVLHSCCHISFSPNVMHAGSKANVIPDNVELDVDIRILPGDTAEEVERHLLEAIGPELMASVEVEPLFDGVSTRSTTETPLWSALVDSVQMTYPGARVLPSMVTGGTDARFFRKKGIPAYGAGLLSSHVSPGEFMSRFHGHNERIDVESLRLTTKLWLDVADRLWT